MSDCKAAPEYELHGYYWVTLTTPGQVSDQFIYRGPAYNNGTYHVLEARHHPGKFVTLSNTQMERFAERMYDRPHKGETWVSFGSKKGVPFYNMATVKVVDVAGDWVIYVWPSQSSGLNRALLLSEFTEKYRKAEPA